MATSTLPTAAEMCAPPVVDLDTIFALAVALPGGAQLLPKFSPGDIPNFSTAIAKLIGELNAALTPLVPIFRIIDAVMAVFECIKAIPESILTLNPEKLIKAIVKLAKAIGFLVQLVPQLSVPVMIITILNAVIVGLNGLKEMLTNIISVKQDLALAQARVTALLALGLTQGAANLQASIDCAEAHLEVQQEASFRSLCPLNALLGLLSIFLQLIGQPAINAIDAGEELEPALVALDAAIQVLEAVKAALPPGVGGSGC